MAKTIGSDQSEGQTPIEDISGLIPKIHSKKELDLAEYRNYTKAVAKYRLMSGAETKKLFTYEGFCQIHFNMLGEVWKWAGERRKTDKSIGVPKEKIGSELHRILFELQQWENEKMPVEERAMLLHHRLVWIHPFENGNGRWARLIINIYLRRMKANAIQWPVNPEFVQTTFRPRYLKAMKTADHGDFTLLRELHQECS